MDHAPLQPCPEALALMTKPMLVQPVFAPQLKNMHFRTHYKGKTFHLMHEIVLDVIQNPHEVNHERQVRRHELHQRVLSNLIQAYTYAEDRDIPGAYGVSALYKNSTLEYRNLMHTVMQRYQKRFRRATKRHWYSGGHKRQMRLAEATVLADMGLSPFYRDEIGDWYNAERREHTSLYWIGALRDSVYMKAALAKAHPEWIWK